jgi:hypothetical protein
MLQQMIVLNGDDAGREESENKNRKRGKTGRIELKRVVGDKLKQ